MGTPSITPNNATITENTTGAGGAGGTGGGAGGSGGSVIALSANGDIGNADLSITDTDILDNTGGAISIYSGGETAGVQRIDLYGNVTFTGNSAGGDGGAISMRSTGNQYIDIVGNAILHD